MLTGPIGGVGEVLAALQRLHGFGQSCADLGAIEQGRVEGVREEFGGGHGNGPQGDAHALDARGQEGSGEAHHPVGRHPAAGLWVQPEGPKRDVVSDEMVRGQTLTIPIKEAIGSKGETVKKVLSILKL